MAQSPSQRPSLPEARLVRTTHNADGLSVFVSDSTIPSYSPFGPQESSFAVFDKRETVPVNNTDAVASFAESLPRCPPQGALFGLTDIKAGGRAPMHRTESLDYCVIVSGEIIMVLDSGEEKTVKAGEFIVQQGVNHSWVNKSNETCRMLFVMLGAQQVQTSDGIALEETVFKS